MILRSIFIIILVSGIVWLRFHNEGKDDMDLTLPSLSDASGKVSEKMMGFCLENPEKCQNILKKLNNSSDSE